jgi:DNA polymerase-4
MATVFFHVDIDAFFASVEQMDEPRYKGKPVIVGALPGHRGVVSTCSYEARAFGVHSAMPINEAAKRCPDAVFLPVRMDRYQTLSEEVFSVFSDFSPKVTRVSIDEAFLDMSGMERLLGEPRQAGQKIKDAVMERTGLCISVGAAANRFVAKLASAKSKPNGLIVVEPGRESAFVDELPLSKLWGAGDKTQDRFREMNIRSMEELRRYDVELLKRIFGKAMGAFLHQAARGLDCLSGDYDSRSQSVSTERTFETDIHDQECLEASLLEAAQDVMYQLYTRSLQASTAFIKIRYSDFRSVSAQTTLRRPISSSDELYRNAVGLFREKREAGQAVRLLGLGASNLESGMEIQSELFDQGRERDARLERAVFSLKKNGKQVKKARNIVPPED